MRLFFLLLLFVFPLYGVDSCFILQDVKSGCTLVQEGNASTPLSPYSTFKIVLSLIGYDSEILQNAEVPVWPYEEKYKINSDFFLDKWAADHNPTSWIKNSCVWFSQLLTERLGAERFSEYVQKLGYGNLDLTGDHRNGLSHAWLGSSLRITPLEQVSFLNRLVKEELPLSSPAHKLTKRLLYEGELTNGMSLFGKTGGGFHAMGQETDMPIAWFVGWVEKEDKQFSFVYVLRDNGNRPLSTAQVKEELKKKLVDNLCKQ